jgi:hypothetical protein
VPPSSTSRASSAWSTQIASGLVESIGDVLDVDVIYASRYQETVL